MSSWTRIVVGVDGSAGSTHALRWAADEARQHGTELHVIMTYTIPTVPVAFGYSSVPFGDERAGGTTGQNLEEANWANEWRSDVENQLQSVVSDTLGDQPDLRLRIDAVEGPAAYVLIEASHDADLLVVGTRGRGGFAGMLLGSVSQHLTIHAACTVAVVRDERPDI